MPTNRPSRLLALFTALTAALFLAGPAGFAGTAGAHARLLDSFPIADSVVAGVSEVSLEFDSLLIDDSDLSLRVLTISGEELTLTRLRVDGAKLLASMPAVVPAGDYVVRYAATSSDGDLNSGGFAFSVAGTTASGSGVIPIAAIALGMAIVVWVGFKRGNRRR